jgi:murein DD-endopeptidase MepM/ murein hydrolase activator NlpD
VKPGQWVEKGVQLGTMGKTGTLVEGAHVHFEVWFLGQRVDPSQYLPSLPASIADLR